LKDNEDRLAESLRRDLGKPEFESFIGEIQWLLNDIVFVTKNLAKWMKDEKAPDISFPWILTSPRIRKDPLGAVLVIG
jgi:beta-apo-4'-carotenal oxygenase